MSEHGGGAPSKFTPERIERFLQELRETANVSLAAAAAGWGRRTAYDYKAKSEEFAAEWDSAFQEGLDRLEASLFRRAVHGVEKPVYQGGELVGTVKEYSDTAAIFLLKGGRPEKYRERVDLNNNGPLSLKVDL